MKKQFSLTRAALSTGGCAESKFLSVSMRYLIRILPIFLCCFTLMGQQQGTDSMVKSNAVQSGIVHQRKDPLVEKYKENAGWVKLTASIEKQGALARKLQSQINSESEVVRTRTAAKQDASVDRAELMRLRQTHSSVTHDISDMIKQRQAIEATIKLREVNKK